MKLKSPVGTTSSSVASNAVSPTETQQTAAASQSTTVIQVSTALVAQYIPENVLSVDTSVLLSHVVFH